MKHKITSRILRISALSFSLILAFNFISPNFFEKSNVQALGDLSVNWSVPEGNPIFTVANFAPGQSQARNVQITNGGSGSRPVGARSEIVDDSDGLSQMIDFKISDGATDLYGGTSATGPKTLANFFAEGVPPNGVFMSNLNAGATKTYTFTAKFKEESGNEYQGDQVMFNIIIGITIDLPDECEQRLFSQAPIFGTSKGDSLKGTAGNDIIVGFEGGDSIDGKGGDDCILGGDGGDSIKGGAGNDIVDGQTGGDSAKGENGDDIIYGSAGGDSLDGGDGKDKLYGGDGHDSIDGRNQNDELFGGSGDDSLSGDNGDDKLYGEDGKDSLKGGSGNDTLLGGATIFDSAHGNGGTDICDAESENSCELEP